MKFEEGERYVVFDVSGKELGELKADERGEPIWPESVNGWKHALDCTIEPYNEQSIDENVEFAKQVHKLAIVMRA